MGIIILNIDSLLKNFEKTFYAEPVMILLNIIFLVVGFRVGPPGKKYRVLLLYAIAALTQDMIALYAMLTEKTSISFKISHRTVATSAICFTVIEFFAFFTFFYLQFEGQPRQQRVRKIRNILTVLATLSTAFYLSFSHDKDLRALIGYLSIILSIIQLIPAFYYFVILFNEPPTKNLLREPTFWITTGIAFLHGLTIPLFLIEHYVLQMHSSLWFSLYTVNFVAYSFLFFLFTVAVGCGRSIKRSIAAENLQLWLIND